ncbi:MAG: RtcB family protein [Anaerolineales bacterium]|nr:RtcB family protein [Anaerolineales bacterium]
MASKTDFHKAGEYLWDLPASHRGDMQTAVRIIADDALLEDALGDLSVEQAVNVACLPGLAGRVVVMPDVHQGYGMPIGGVMAADLDEGVISPGAVGYDINCGVRLLSTTLPWEEAEPHLADLATALYRNCPSGVGEKGSVPLTTDELDRVCREGARWALRKGYALADDVERTEEGGCLEGADPEQVSARAKERGRGQLGTLGAGNHFLEVDVVEQVFDAAAAEAMGLREGRLALQIHCGSRGFGHQICTDYVQSFQSAVRRYGIRLPDRELVCAPIGSPEGRAYLGAMKAAANFAFANRQVLAHHARRSFEEVFGGKGARWELCQVYDIAHNMAKIETHTIDGRKRKVCVHRKGATRAFGPGGGDIPADYRALGQPVLVPGSMGTASWVLLGTPAGMELSYGSCCHGAGRLMSRAKAKREIRGEKLRGELEQRGVRVRAGSLPGLAEEAPQAYKDVDRVVAAVCGAGIGKKVARLRPAAVVKG